MNGFTFYMRGKDYFVQTERTRKTKALATAVLPLVGCSVTDHNIDAILNRMQKATCEIRTCENTTRNEKRYYEISGENFGGRGSWLDDGETVILSID